MMDKTLRSALVGLLTSRKNLVAVFAVLSSGAIVLFGMYRRMEKELIMAMAAVPTTLAWKLIGAIAQEDAATSAADGHVGAAQATAAATIKAASMHPPPMVYSIPMPVSVPPPPGVPAESKEPSP